MIVVIDTCALLWLTLEPQRLSDKARLEYARADDRLVASISVWEIGIKCKKHRLDLGTSFEEYCEILKKCPELSFIPIDADLWVKSVSLQWDHSDPADRLIVSLAMKHEATILTSDDRIKKYYDRCMG
jgi:PIN domain nuclease of toxin-antitoxin system